MKIVYLTLLTISIFLTVIILIKKYYMYMIGKIILAFIFAFIISFLMNIKKILS
ncbi:Uncharacterised protein [[Clostridium] sordellii]|uniref:hypothetical protein n=1 Tax=Paraclostridium sordellii TaxID=1505 RepID=UPI0005E27408|nr:hypothetical protein [Paeniclostridium sordellii]CEN23682.1 Uncharacterised protein [[Clostridium] sordellii] [Paeniclostridium sordellii]